MIISIRVFRCVLWACALVLAAGCKGGGSPASSSSSAPAVPAPTPTVAAAGAPTISGSASTSLKANETYSFTPAASDPNGDTLSFQIQNKPSWAVFNTVNGQLTGTPTSAQTGDYANIVISVSDGALSASLPAFTINVGSVASASKTVTVAWIAPTQNVDGSALTDLAGFIIAYGTSQAALSNTVRIDNASVDQYMLEDLASGTYYFAIKAYSTGGAESALSDVVSTVVN